MITGDKQNICIQKGTKKDASKERKSSFSKALFTQNKTSLPHARQLSLKIVHARSFSLLHYTTKCSSFHHTSKTTTTTINAFVRVRNNNKRNKARK